MLEIAVFNIQSALLAATAGAHRLELCENPYDGGTTPSYGTLKTVREKISIPVFPIIRPRGGDFLYNDAEYEVICKDVQLCKELGFDGVVIGLLHADGSIDKEWTKKLVDLAYPMEVTFHRAFDRAAHPLQALEDIIACGCNRILTSGQVPNAWDGRELIKQLVEKADDRIIIMPGSGVRSSNIKALADFTGAKELHSSARELTPSGMQFQTTSMQENLQNTIVDTTEIKKMLAAL
ncbi:copper homeostasis protein CutC [Asinibacterium sp. OR53]|uniref:copper homeostasis protein CutC n=1 Tax=Asinibacterium sp. OR53 TaxID=925409 RepID=UPI00047C5FA9|nr:copper homeostasis protein CutC [Asinibacterium sp. OR53]